MAAKGIEALVKELLLGDFRDLVVDAPVNGAADAPPAYIQATAEASAPPADGSLMAEVYERMVQQGLGAHVSVLRSNQLDDANLALLTRDDIRQVVPAVGPAAAIWEIIAAVCAEQDEKQ